MAMSWGATEPSTPPPDTSLPQVPGTRRFRVCGLQVECIAYPPNPVGSTNPARSQAASSLPREGLRMCETCVDRILRDVDPL